MYSLLKRSLAAFASLFVAAPLWAQTATLENPQPGATVSGITAITGWKCTAGEIKVSFDGGPQYIVGYGTIREDTLPACGDTNNGFSFLWNWGRLSDGSHTVQLFDNGVEFANVNINVMNYGTEFLTDVTNSTLAPNFPVSGQTATLTWQQSLQSFVVTKIEALSPPASGSFDVSGFFELNHCTTPGNNASHLYTTTLSITPDRFGFVGTTGSFPFGPSLQAFLSLEGTFYGDSGFYATGGVRGTLAVPSSTISNNLSGYFSSGVITDVSMSVTYRGVASFPEGEGICQFEGSFTATRIP